MGEIYSNFLYDMASFGFGNTLRIRFLPVKLAAPPNGGQDSNKAMAFSAENSICSRQVKSAPESLLETSDRILYR